MYRPQLPAAHDTVATMTHGMNNVSHASHYDTVATTILWGSIAHTTPNYGSRNPYDDSQLPYELWATIWGRAGDT